jgi:hypothetical protein
LVDAEEKTAATVELTLATESRLPFQSQRPPVEPAFPVWLVAAIFFNQPPKDVLREQR